MDTSFEQKKRTPVGSVGIEFGNTFFRWAFTLKSDPFRPYCPKEQSNRYNLISSTSLLVSPEGENGINFGTNADKEYRLLCDAEKHRHYYFRNVLQDIFKQSAISKSTVLGDIQNKQLQSHKILQMVMEYVMSSTLSFLDSVISNAMMYELFSWTVTVPSLWNESVVSLMKECACRKGLDQSNFNVLPHAVAASLCSKHLVTRNNNKTGNAIMIVHVEETVDICFQEKIANDAVTMKELETPNEDIRCGSIISANFDKFMIDICGHKTWANYKEQSFDDYHEVVHSLFRQIENNKDHVIIRLSCFNDDDTVMESIQNAKYSAGFKIKRDKIFLGKEITFQSFYATIESTIKNVFRNLKANKDFKKTESVILTGGFANVDIIKEVVKTEFPDAKIIVPSQANICALMGAVRLPYLSSMESQGNITTAIYAVPLVVGAIDFGTTFSGWAMSFRHEFLKDPADIYAKDWNSGENLSNKAPTTILIRPDGETFEAFGYKAENRYAGLLAEQEHHDYFFFQRFKMLLYDNKELSRETELQASNGKSLKAMVVFKLALQYLKDNLIAESQSRLSGGINASEIHWSLTVPAIWNEKAKRFMREAAIKAGIDSRYLTLTLEPEAASLFVQHLKIGRDVDGKVEIPGPGTQYIVVDCGGGTIDICCHEIQPHGGVSEIEHARGNDMGGIRVDEAFENMLIEMFGHESWQRFKGIYLEDYLTLQRSFEIKKRNIAPDNEALISFSLPASLLEDVKHPLPPNFFGGSVRCQTGGKIRVEAKFARERFFGNVLEEIKALLMKTTKSSSVGNVKTIVLVGGFGESDMVRMCIKENFPNYTLIAPKQSSLTIVKGAVIFGHDTSVVTERIARYTYGTATLIPFDARQHSRTKVHTIGGQRYVREFRILVKEDSKLPCTFKIDDGSVVPRSKRQTEMRFPLFAVDGDTLPKYIDDGDYIHLGELVVKITDNTIPRDQNEFSVKYIFGGTEISAIITEVKTGKQTEGFFEFLG